MKIGRVIQCLRTAKKLSLVELARLIQTTSARLESWESERSSPPLFDVFAISSALGVPAYTIFLIGNAIEKRKGERRRETNYYAALRGALGKMTPSQRSAVMQFAETLSPNRQSERAQKR